MQQAQPEHDHAVVVDELTKRFGDVVALRGASLRVKRGTILGLLGPNGAGKTTMVRILTTLLEPTSGRASVLGLDVVKDAAELRTRIALSGQFAAVDELLTGRENLVMVGQLYRLPKAEARRRADNLLERFELTDAVHRIAKTYSGGMRRRLDLAASLVAQPEVLFLDEPTTGLDPRSRLGLWDIIRELVEEGTTLLLTTQYLEEADRLADTIAVIDGGRVIAEGTADELKSRVGGDVLELRTVTAEQLERARAALATAGFDGDAKVDLHTASLRLAVSGGDVLTRVVRLLDQAGVELLELALHRPTLDDVFLALTGHSAEDQAQPVRGRGRRGRKDGKDAAATAAQAGGADGGESA
ncbi:MAG TPA: ATP-binding cassette domain-containing protein [Candidatus Dormibacteraeota bacterium]|jgi:ABC-2 type transport system ATP-binding protein|nr:ATP-binding cassette domain-containing protein [Candidatus Dormibacteraeota bacterium]